MRMILCLISPEIQEGVGESEEPGAPTWKGMEEPEHLALAGCIMHLVELKWNAAV